MVRKVSGKKKGRTITVDMSGVESGGKAVPDGVYEVEVAEITEEESSEGNPYLKWKLRVTEGPCKGAPLYDNTSLQPQALWRLKGLLETLGVEVPDSSMDLDLEEYVGMTMTVTVANEEYQGKDRPKVAQYGGEEKNERAPAGKKGGGKGKAKAEEPEDDDDDDDDDEPAFKLGQKVKFTDDGKTLKGKVVQIEGDTATVKTSDGEDWEIATEDLTAV